MHVFASSSLDDENNTNVNTSPIHFFNTCMVDELDQQQPYHSGVFCSGLFAQSFKPTLEIITRAELYIFKGSGGLQISICNDLNNIEENTITTVYTEHEDIPSGENWVEFDFPDAVVIPNQEYYIVFEPDDSMFWEQHLKDPYEQGCSWKYLSDEWENISDLDFVFKTYGNKNAPFPPTLSGPTIGEADTSISFILQATDLDNDELYYYIDWGDTTNPEWIGPYASGEQITIDHIWTQAGIFTIRAKVKDIHHVESNWSEPATITIHKPDLEIIEISSGFGSINAMIQNNGDATAVSIPWSISIDGIVSNSYTSGVIDSLDAEDIVSVQTAFIVGIGKITITVTVADVSKMIEATIFGPFIIL